MSSDQVGAIIECGPSDWQIIQQNGEGVGSIELRGRWVHPEPGVVHGGYGANPDTVPADMERFLPMVGFYGVAIREK
ncbi:MAG: hypothetical protein AUJ92_11120 [Armatimonadetes bacterium CG2_30_59_28]|nr:hypothetical protein [Armatimonadota bacterium]OIO94004.1 MAG: hypothetical protein AUJ92_11120 [Armatimonadetes bacterium CG2_30_59_28]PIU62398.1 MAG: hypothetical protein COS85_18545 [Armatimonadetes bacterium CG07_land_8_20_14_0_80_59_28]PIX40000.1 MAG: hypothetical protein COZ56_15900 [Armatimonadetes bacterium CG_4_8_14_3_um_filter_58_9]PIY48947.1 MAG: hypothetical protein COZ05_01725 [Armatimonadetes bacterium CG_4_10_14_3_um_filter_59_10]